MLKVRKTIDGYLWRKTADISCSTPDRIGGSREGYIHMCIYIYIYMYTHIHVYTCTHRERKRERERETDIDR